MKIALLVLSTLIIAGSAPLAMAAPDPGLAAPARDKPMPRLKRLDTNGDTRISAAEWAARKGRPAPKAFERLDLNHDGFVDASELQARMKSGRAQLRAERLEKRAGRG
jgi:hypothetical protein